MRARLVRILSVVLMTAVYAACGDDDPTSPPPPPPPPPPPVPGRMVLDNPEYQANIQEIWERNGCTQSQCHGVSPGQASLDLTSANSHAQLVGRASSQDPAFTLVVPDTADVSLLFLKVSETSPPVGGLMPAGGPQMDTIDINNVRNWINTGAPNN